MTVTEEELAGLFEEWKKRYDTDPERFMDCEQFAASEPQTYGQLCANYMLWLIQDLGEGNFVP